MDDDNKREWRAKISLKKSSKKIKKQARRMENATLKHAHRFLLSRWEKIREVRRRIIIWLGGVGILIALVGVQMLWFQQSYVVEAPVSGGTYAEALRGPIDTLNPLFASSSAELSVSHLLFSSLYDYDETGRLRGDLAVGMKNEGDRLFTVDLRKDASWHDDQPLSADDVVFTIGLIKNPSVRSVLSPSWQGIEIKKVNDHAISFSLPAAYAAFPQALTFPVLPKHIVEKVSPELLRESDFSQAPVGSGPFTLRLLQTVNQSSGRKIVHIDANQSYYSGPPRLEHVQLHSFNDDESMARALRTGEVSAVSDISGVVAKTLDDKKRYSIITRPVNSGVYALFNQTSTALKDINVRRALQLGTNTTDIRLALFGNPQPLGLPFTKGQVNEAEEIPLPKSNKAEAIKILESNGWVMKDGVRTKGNDRLRLRVVTRQNPDFEITLNRIAGQWRELGADINVEVVAGSNFTQDVLRLRNYDVLVDKLVIGGDPDVFAYWHSRGILNFTGYGNQIVDDALTSARTKSDPALRSIKYTLFAKQWLNDIPAIGLYQPNLNYIHIKKAETIGKNEVIVTPDDHYSNVLNWTTEKRRVYKTP
jgi:peptide/nickel transport system substrate-binding protein